MEQSQGSVWRHLLVTVISISGMVVIVWAEMPPDERRWTALAARSRLQTMLHRTARSAGDLGMGSELAGHGPAAHAGYGLAYRLAVLRDRM